MPKKLFDIDVVEFSMFVYKLFRCHPQQRFNLIYHVNKWTLLALLILSTVVTVIDFMKNDNQNKKNHLNVTFFLLLVTIQAYLKVIYLLLCKKDIIYGISCFNKFWNIDDVKISHDDKMRIKSSMMLHMQLLKTYCLVGVIAVITSLPRFNMFYAPNLKIITLTTPMMIMLKLLISYKITYVVALVVGCDVFLIYACTLLSANFQLLAHRVQVIVAQKSENFRAEMAECIKYHNFLCSYWAFINSLWSPFFLCMFLNTLYSLASQIIILVSVEELDEIIFNLIFYIAVLFQYSLYCLPISHVSESAQNVGNLVYESEWYASDLDTMKRVQFMILRAQKDCAFSAAGLVTIDRENLTNVFKTSISAYALARMFKDKFV